MSVIPLLTPTVADFNLLQAIRLAPDDAMALGHITAARVEATVSIADLYAITRDKLLAEQARASRLRIALEQQAKSAKEALST